MHREKDELFRDNPLFSPSEDSQEKCWDVTKETESTKKSARSMSRRSGSNSAAAEIAMVSPINTLKSSERASPESSRTARESSSSKTGNAVQSIVHSPFDEESQDMEEFRTRIMKFMEQEDEVLAAYNETGNIPSPLIIQYGGVASYHPVYSPFAPRPRFLRFRGLAPAIPKNEGRPIEESPEMERREEEIKEDVPQGDEHISSGGDEDSTSAANGPELALNAGLDNKGNENITPSRAEPAAGHTEGARSVETDHKMAANCPNVKETEKKSTFRKRKPMIWAASIILVFSVSLTAVTPAESKVNGVIGPSRFAKSMELLNQIREVYRVTEPSRLNLRVFKEYFKRFQEPSLAAMKFIFNLESLRASLLKISDFGLLCFRSERFSYFRSVGGSLMMELYVKLKSIGTRCMVSFKIFCMHLLVSMMNVAAAVPRFCKCLNSGWVVDTDPSNAGAGIHGTNVGKFEKPTLRPPSNRLRHENFEQIVLSLILGMDICPREDTMNTCPIPGSRDIAHGSDHDDIYNEDRSVLTTIQQHDGIGLIQEQANSTHAETHNSPRFDQIFPEDQENRLWAGRENSEIFVWSPEQTESQQINLEDQHINGTAEVPIIEQNPHEFWLLIWASLIVAASLALMLLMFKGLILRSKFLSGPYSSQTSKEIINISGGDHITESKEEQKSIARYSGAMTQTTMESTESPGFGMTQTTMESTESPPGFGSFFDYVDIPVSSEGSRSKELKATSVRRSMRIRNRSLSPLRCELTFTSPL